MKLNKNGFIGLIFIVCFFSNTYYTMANKETDSLLTPKQMREDVRFFYKTLLRIHPNPYQVLAPEKLDIKIKEIIKGLNEPLSRRKFWLKIAALNAYFDGHTQISQIVELYKCQDSSLWLPENTILCINDDLFFNTNLPFLDTVLQGKKIKKINNISSKDIIALGKRYTSIEYHRFKLFPSLAMLYLYNFYTPSDTIFIEYELENGIAQRAFTANDFKVSMYSEKENRKDNPCNFRLYAKDSIAILEINTFNINKFIEKGIDYNQYISSVFDSISLSKTKYLFIDISSNSGGGSDCAFQVLDYLVPHNNTTYSTGISIFKISPELKKLRAQENMSWISYHIKLLFDEKVQEFGKKKNGDFYYKKWDWKPSEVNTFYKGHFYVIQGLSSYSAAITMLSFIKTNKICPIIGEETSGLTSGYIDFASGMYMKNSKIPFTCSTQYFEDVGSKVDGRGVIPDIEYKIKDNTKSFTLKQLKEMLELANQYQAEI